MGLGANQPRDVPLSKELVSLKPSLDRKTWGRTIHHGNLLWLPNARIAPRALAECCLVTANSEDEFISLLPTLQLRPLPAPDMMSPDKAPTTNARHEDTNVSARRLKKREIDRRCQRQAREKTKSRMAYLEGLVDHLTQSDADERSAALMKRLADTEKERDALAQTLKEIQKALSAHGPEIKTEPEDDEPSSRHNGQDIDLDESPEHINGNSYLPLDRHDSYESRKSNVEHTQLLGAPKDLVEAELPKVCDDVCDCCNEAREGSSGIPKSLWRYANNTLIEPYKGHSPITPEEDLLAEDIPVRVILEGWDAVDQQLGLPVSWRFLRQIDENLFSQCGPTERLAILRTMHLLLQYHRDPTPERRAKLPPWFLARPSQSIPHAYAINYFVWPGLRERFIFQQHKYCSNLFWQLFSGSIEMSWAYDFRDCFAQRWDTGVYQMTPMFHECISDISRWTMRNDLFTQFPDLRCDIPASTLSPRGVSNLVQLQLGHIKPSQASSSIMAQNTRASRNDEIAKQQQFMESWNSVPPWMESNTMFMASQTDNMMATPWIS